MTQKDLGRLVNTASVDYLRKENSDFNRFVMKCLDRYLNNDWGDLTSSDKKINDDAVESGDDRIMAVYNFPPDASWRAVSVWGSVEKALWIITEWDHSYTTVLFPSEY